MASIEQLTTTQQWKRVQEDPGLSLVFKHSTTCPISAAAHDRFNEWAAQIRGTGPKVYRVHVIEDRPLSQEIAADTGITHQSPQALLMRKGQVLWHASHHAITADSLTQAVAEPDATPSHSTGLLQAQQEQRAKLAQTGN